MKTILLAFIMVFATLTSFAQGSGLFSSKKSISTSTGNMPSVIDSGTIDGDNRIDIIIGTTLGNTIEWYKNNGNGTFSLQTLVTSNLVGVMGLTLADLDGDNDNDIVATAYFGAKVVWFENNGNGTFSSEKVIASGIGEAGAVKVAQIDNNSTKDVIVAAGTAGQVLWFSNDGNGNFTGGAQLVGANGSTPRSIDIADFNNDGDIDVVVGYIGSGNVELYENQLVQNGGSSVSFVRDSNVISSSNSNLNEVSFGDVNNDNQLDIIKVNKNGLASWHKKETNGSYTKTSFSTAYSKPATAKIADYDDDTTNDLVIGFANSGMDAMTYFDNASSESLIDNTQDDINQFTINDFDGDGDLDIASISQQQNALNWFENQTYAPSLSTSEKEIQELGIYPNPAINELNFTFSNLNKDFKIQVYNVTGKKISENLININNPKLDISRLSRGVYLLNFVDFNTTLKFVKQ